MTVRLRILLVALSLASMLAGALAPAQAHRFYNEFTIWNSGSWYADSEPAMDHGHNTNGYSFNRGEIHDQYANPVARPVGTLRVRTWMQFYNGTQWVTCSSITAFRYNTLVTHVVQQSKYWDAGPSGPAYQTPTCGPGYYFSSGQFQIDSTWGSGNPFWVGAWVGCDATGDSHYFI